MQNVLESGNSTRTSLGSFIQRLPTCSIVSLLHSYETFMPIHHMWCSYMAELMNLQPKPADISGSKSPQLPPRMPNAAAMHAKLVKADLHGCIIRGAPNRHQSNAVPTTAPANRHSGSAVQQSRNPSLVGCTGIVIHETENTFKIVTHKNTLKSLYLIKFTPRSFLNWISWLSDSEGKFCIHVLDTALRS